MERKEREREREERKRGKAQKSRSVWPRGRGPKERGKEIQSGDGGGTGIDKVCNINGVGTKKQTQSILVAEKVHAKKRVY